MSINRWLNKENRVPINNGILQSYEKDEILPIPTKWVQLKTIVLSESKPIQKKTNIIYFSWLVVINTQNTHPPKREVIHRYRSNTQGLDYCIQPVYITWEITGSVLLFACYSFVLCYCYYFLLAIYCYQYPTVLNTWENNNKHKI